MIKKFSFPASLLLIFFMLFICSSLTYSADSQKQRFEIAAMAGVSGGFSATTWGGTHVIGDLNLGWYITPAFEIEPNVVVVEAEDVVFSLNLNINIPGGKQLIPYLGGGLGVCVHGTLFFNVSGGLKLRIRDRLGLRGEFKYFSFEEDGTSHDGGVFLAGIFYTF